MACPCLGSVDSGRLGSPLRYRPPRPSVLTCNSAHARWGSCRTRLRVDCDLHPFARRIARRLERDRRSPPTGVRRTFRAQGEVSPSSNRGSRHRGERGVSTNIRLGHVGVRAYSRASVPPAQGLPHSESCAQQADRCSSGSAGVGAAMAFTLRGSPVCVSRIVASGGAVRADCCSERHHHACEVAYAYLEAKALVLTSGFGWEVDWQEDAARDPVTEQRFLRELAWVVLSSGLSERVVRSSFPGVSKAFINWESAAAIWQGRSACRARALAVFNSRPKVDAILTTAGYIHQVGFDVVCGQLVEHDGLEFLMRFPFLGPATARHLAKNLGVNVAKPDRHLQRLAASVGYENAGCLCDEISTIVGDPIAVVDIVLWRFATLCRPYLDTFAEALRQAQSVATTGSAS